MEVIEKKKTFYISGFNCHIHIRYMSLERKTPRVFSCLAYMHAPAGNIRELGNHVNTTGTGSMHVVASRVATSYG
jgi:hypothetical protein